MLSVRSLFSNTLQIARKFGNSLWAMRRVFGHSQHLMLEELHTLWGDQFRFPLGRRMATVLADPHAIREMFEQNCDVLSAAESRRRLVGVLPPKSVPYQQGEAHARARKALGRAFAHTSDQFQTHHLMDTLIECLRDGRDLEQAVTDYCYRLASEFVFGRVDHELGKRLKEAVESAGAIRPLVLAFPVFRRLPGTARQFRRLAESRDAFLQVIAARLDAGESRFSSGSLASGLLKHGAKVGMSRAEIRDNLGMVAMATAFNLRIVLINAIHALAENPQWQARLRDSAADSGRSPHAEAMRLSRAMIKECLRMSPVVPLVSRMVKEDVVIGGTSFKAGQIIFASPWITHFRPADYADPLKYDPTRFLNGGQHGYNFIPFGGGSNHCLGSGWSIDMAASFITRLVEELHIHGDSTLDDRHKFSYEVFNLVRRRCDAKVTVLSPSHATTSRLPAVDCVAA